MSYVAIEKSLGSPTDLLKFYVPGPVSKVTLTRLSADDQIFVICNMAEALAACDKAVDATVLRNQSVEASPILFEVCPHLSASIVMRQLN
jgi:hypothetical protein